MNRTSTCESKAHHTAIIRQDYKTEALIKLLFYSLLFHFFSKSFSIICNWRGYSYNSNIFHYFVCPLLRVDDSTKVISPQEQKHSHILCLPLPPFLYSFITTNSPKVIPDKSIPRMYNFTHFR